MQISSSPVFSLYYIGLNLKKGITETTFEAFVQEKGIHIPAFPGWRWTLLKGLRGERKNQYMMMYEAQSSEHYTRFIDSQGQQTPEAIRFWKHHPAGLALIDEWKRFATFGELPVIFSTYSLLAENQHSSLPGGSLYQLQPGQRPVQRVVGIHNLALRSGISAATFDTFMKSNVRRIDDYPGWKFHLLKGTGGNRIDAYAVMLIIESLDSLNAFHPQLDVSTERSRQFVRQHPDSELMYAEWRELASFSGAPQLYTDYLTIAGNI